MSGYRSGGHNTEVPGQGKRGGSTYQVERRHSWEKQRENNVVPGRGG